MKKIGWKLTKLWITERDEKERLRKIIIIIRRKDKTKTERFPTKVGNLNKEKTKRKQKGLRLKSETLIKKEKTEQKQKGLPTLSADL